MPKGRARIFGLNVPIVFFLLAGILAQTVLYSNKAGKVCASGYNIHSQSGYTSLPKQDEVCQSEKLSKSEIVQKTKRLQMPFIANKGQMDEQVGFYAMTFGGTVFVTKDGEIVYSLPQVIVENAACRTKGTDYASQIENYVYPSLYKSPIVAGLTEYSASKNLQSEFNDFVD